MRPRVCPGGGAPVLRFRYASGTTDWTPLPVELDASLLSDEVGTRWRFTGAFFVLCAQNHTLKRIPADFDHFSVFICGPPEGIRGSHS